MLSTYVHVLRSPGAIAFSSAGLLARLPMSMTGLGIVMLVTAQRGSYALAGVLSAVFAVAASLLGPLGSRYADRFGQHRLLPILAALSGTSLLVFVAGVLLGWPDAALIALVAVAGATTPNVSSMVRARWALLLSGTPALRTAFALESVLDEVIFVVGPPLATVLALQVAPPAALVTAVSCLLIGSAALSVQRASEPPPAHHDHRGGRAAIRYPGMLALVAVMVGMGGIFGSVEVTTVAFGQEQGAPAATGILLAVYAFGSLVAGVVVGAMHLAVPLHRQLLAAAAFAAVVTLPFPVVGNVPVMAVVAFLAGLAVSPVLIATFALVERLVPAQRLTEGLTVASSGIGVGLALAASLSGYLIDVSGSSAGYLVTAGSGVLALLAVLAAGRTLARAEAAAAQPGDGLPHDPAVSWGADLIPGGEPGLGDPPPPGAGVRGPQA